MHSSDNQEAFSSIWDIVGSYHTSDLNEMFADGKEPPELSKVMEDEALIQEVKGHNVKLLEYLKENMKKVLQFLTQEPSEEDVKDKSPEDDVYTFKFPYITCEIICCDVPEISQHICGEDELLAELFEYLKTMNPSKERNPAKSQYFLKAFSKLISKHYSNVAEYILKSHSEKEDYLENCFLKNIHVPDMDKLILRLLGFHVEDSFDETMSFGAFTSEQRFQDLFEKGNSNSTVSEQKKAELKQWAIKNKFFSRLVEILDKNPDDEDVHKNIFHMLSFIIDKGYDTLGENIKSEKVLTSFVEIMLKNPESSMFTHGIDFLHTVIDHSDILYEDQSETVEKEKKENGEIPGPIKVILSYTEKFVALLKVEPKNSIQNPSGTLKIPLGVMRLKVIEHVRVLFKLKYEEIHKTLGETSFLVDVVDLFFQYPHHNIFHANMFTICRAVQAGNVKRNHEILLQDAKLIEKLIQNAEEDIESRKEHYSGSPIVGHCVNIGLLINSLKEESEKVKEILSQYEKWEWYTNVYLKEVKRVSDLQLGGSNPLSDFNVKIYDERKVTQENSDDTSKEKSSNDFGEDESWNADFE